MEAIIEDRLDSEYQLLISERLLLLEENSSWRIYKCYRISPANGPYDCNYLGIKLGFYKYRYEISDKQLELIKKSIMRIFGKDLVWFEVVQPITPQDIAMYGPDKKIEIIIRDVNNARSWDRIR